MNSRAEVVDEDDSRLSQQGRSLRRQVCTYGSNEAPPLKSRHQVRVVAYAGSVWSENLNVGGCGPVRCICGRVSVGVDAAVDLVAWVWFCACVGCRVRRASPGCQGLSNERDTARTTCCVSNMRCDGLVWYCGLQQETSDTVQPGEEQAGISAAVQGKYAWC